jgi:hypothetical protein
MESLKQSNTASLGVLALAASLYVIGVSLCLALSSPYLPGLLGGVALLIAASAALTLVSLIQARKLGLISTQYLVLSLLTCFFVGLAWLVLPWVLRQDLKDGFEQARQRASLANAQ